MKIIQATKKHITVLFNIENTVFFDDTFALSKSSLRYHLNHNIFFIVYEKKEALGYILWLERKSYFRLYSLAILPQHQGKGIASKLLQHSIEALTCKDFSLEVKQSNLKAIRLYKKHGFVIVKNLLNYYGAENGFLMRKTC